jgi:NADH:ubiquinone oxidoreductase subunit B-like Fe-S oxidoreductase
MYNASYLMNSTDVQRIPMQINITHVPPVTNTIFGAMGNTKKLIRNNKWNKNKVEKMQYFNSLPYQQNQLMPSYKARG